MPGGSQWWEEVLRQSSLLPKVAMATVAALLAFGSSTLHDELQRLPRQLSRPYYRWGLFLAHLVVFAGFALVTDLVFGTRGKAGNAGAWAVAWVVMGWASLGLLMATALPLSLWFLLFRRSWSLLLGGLVAGSLALVASLYTQQLWQPLSEGTIWAVHGLLSLVFQDTVCQLDTWQVGTKSFWVQIWPSCSGYQGIGLIWVFLGIYLWLFRHQLRFPQAFLLLLLGTAIMWLANAMRIAALIAIGNWISPDVALGGFHSQVGWLAFNGVGLGLVVLSRQARFFRGTDELPEKVSGSNPTAAYLTPLVAILATAMVMTALSNGFDRWYALRVLIGGAVLWYFRREYADFHWDWSWTALAIGVGGFVVWVMVLPNGSGSVAEQTMANGLASLPTAGRTLWLFFRVLGAVVTVPVAEELAFRGYATRRFIAADFQDVPLGKFTWMSFLASSAIFGALHNSWIAGMLAGMLYALALYRRGQITDAVLAHATTNSLIAGYVLVTGHWYLWS